MKHILDILDVEDDLLPETMNANIFFPDKSDIFAKETRKQEDESIGYAQRRPEQQPVLYIRMHCNL